MLPQVLIVDDEVHIGEALTFALEDRYRVFTATCSREAMSILDKENIDVVLLDLKLGEEDGLEVLANIRHRYPTVEVIVITAYGTIKSSVEAITMGAFYYTTKPLDLNELEVYIKKALQKRRAGDCISQDPEGEDSIYKSIVGTSPPMRQVTRMIEKVKNIDFTVLLTGESGTGKEVVARTIHRAGKRASGPFEVVNCAALPSQLMESELFGYEKGAFTGANTSYPGKFVLADRGTLFLDEIGEMDLANQSKLLRVLQDKVVCPLGSTTSRRVDVRIIAATNRNLREEVEAGRFRADLYYRLNVIEIKLPALRDHKEDIPLLVSYFLKEIARDLGIEPKHISPAAMIVLEHYDYPGNVRELKNILERAVVVSSSQVIEISDLPPYLFEHGEDNESEEDGITIRCGEPLDQVERKVILMNLTRLQRPRKEIAQVLGISERTLRNKLKEYSLQ